MSNGCSDLLKSGIDSSNCIYTPLKHNILHTLEGLLHPLIHLNNVTLKTSILAILAARLVLLQCTQTDYYNSIMINFSCKLDASTSVKKDIKQIIIVSSTVKWSAESYRSVLIACSESS